MRDNNQAGVEVDALNSILNNINVQTKNNYGNGKLPPIWPIMTQVISFKEKC